MDPLQLLAAWKQGYDAGAYGAGVVLSNKELNRAYQLGVAKRIEDSKTGKRKYKKRKAKYG